jgi:hypothetical protein
MLLAALGSAAKGDAVTTWTDVINYVRTRHEVLEDTGSWLRFRLECDGGRTQQVAVHHVPDLDGAEWLEISSPVGRADAIDLRRFLELAGESTIGGAGIVDNVALLKYSAPLEDLSVLDEFARPLELLVARADNLEQELTQADEF